MFSFLGGSKSKQKPVEQAAKNGENFFDLSNDVVMGGQDEEVVIKKQQQEQPPAQ